MPTLYESVNTLFADPNPTLRLTPQRAHRADILRSWLEIADQHSYDLESNLIAKQTLDVGCGQGDMLELIAATFHTQGDEHSIVIGIDPARLDYGSPTTLGDAQSHLSSGPFQFHLSFVQSSTEALMTSQAQDTYTTAYMAHSLYYFPSPSEVRDTFSALLDAGVKTLLLAEWGLKISRPSALPHLLSILTQSIEPLVDGNVRTVLSPDAYIELATKAGWEKVGSRMITPSESLEDGRWEVRFGRDVADGRGQSGASHGESAQAKGANDGEHARSASIRAHADAFEYSIDPTLGVDGITCMDVWVAVFKPASKLES